MTIRTPRGSAALLLLATLVSSAPTRAQTPSALQNLLEAEIARFPGRAGVWVEVLATGERAAVNADDAFNSASVIKLPVLALAFEKVEAGALSLDERIEIRAEDVRGGSGILRRFDPGLQPTFRDVLAQMVMTSDNTATDLAVARVGGVDAVNAWIAARGWAEGMRLNQTTGEIFARYAALPADADRNARTNGDPEYWLGTMTPRATGELLASLERGTLVADSSRAEILGMMRAQLAGARRLPHFLSVPVAHKTGDWPPVLANDVGIVYARSGPIVIAFFANAIVGPYAEAEDRIGRIAQLVVEAVDGAR